MNWDIEIYKQSCETFLWPGAQDVMVSLFILCALISFLFFDDPLPPPGPIKFTSMLTKEAMRSEVWAWTSAKCGNFNYVDPPGDDYVSSLQVTRVTEGTEDPQREDPKECQVPPVYQVHDKHD